MRRRTAVARRTRRPTTRGRDWLPINEHILAPSPGTVLDAVERVPPALDWPTLAPRLVPVLPRLRPYPKYFPAPVVVVPPPGISVGVGVDIGPAFLHVDANLLAHWGRSIDEVLERALSNVRRKARTIDPAWLTRQPIDGVPVSVLHTGGGWASATLLLPDVLVRAFGPAPQLLVAPMRDVVLAMPADVDREFAAWVAEEFESLDPNCLHLGGFLLRDGRLTCEPLEAAWGSA
ncbi:MAG TPA: hypothetical protein VNJ28_03705 [Candidatus Limnocylindrales bacterium]|nr:hypothetical protein [Candidatus Limnocylindrales bacterium]